jgi:hypothetical protein
MKKIEKLLGFKFIRVYYNFFLKLHIGVKFGVYLHLVTNSTHEEEFEVKSKNFLTRIQKFKSILNQIPFDSD